MDSSEMFLQFIGEVKQKDLIFYVVLFVMFCGSLVDLQFIFVSGVLLCLCGWVIDVLDIDEICWLLVGVKVMLCGVDG